jgi:hypothetical protein
LEDNDGNLYVRLRDGNPTSEFTGESCLYGFLFADGFIDRQYQWVPVMGSDEDDMRLTGGPWMNESELIKYGQTPITIPPEPITIPKEI